MAGPLTALDRIFDALITKICFLNNKIMRPFHHFTKYEMGETRNFAHIKCYEKFLEWIHFIQPGRLLNVNTLPGFGNDDCTS